MIEPNETANEEHEGPLDEAMRGRLASLEAGPSPLSGAARERLIAAAVRARRRQLVIRRLAWGAAAATPLAAAVAVWLGMHQPLAPSPVASGDGASGHGAPVEARACERWTAVSSFPLARGPQSLGVRGVVALEADADARVGPSAPCRTEIVLERGGVIVQADDLGGGELFVVAGGHRVEVTGTVFSVRRTDDAIEVEVVEGRVRVDGSMEVRGGERLTAGQIAPLEGARADALRGALAGHGPVAAESPPAPLLEADEASEESEALDVETLALEAERAFRAGDLDEARASFRRAGARSEAALIRWARLELDADHLSQAQAALDLHRRRYGRPRLGAEADFIRMQLADAMHDDAAARAAAEAIVEGYPESPQARAARRRLDR